MRSKKFKHCNPHLPVRNLRETLDYYHDTLGFYDEWTWANEKGESVDGGIRRDDMHLLFGEHANFVESHLAIMWFVENIEEIFLEFQIRKIKIEDGLKLHSYGLREFAFADINGYYIRVAERIEGEK
ncbi:MAG TPA: VOC family protein [Puia sp.]|nr:VOC family protein [Puia sp.]